MRTEDIIKQQETKVSGLLVNAPGLVWGNLYGDINSQKDLAEKFNKLESEIDALTPEGMIKDIHLNGISVVNEDHVATINIPLDSINYNIKKSLDASRRALDETAELKVQLSEIGETIHEEIDPALEELSVEIAKKASSAWYDEEAHFTPEGDTKKYWYLMDSTDFDTESFDDIELHIIKNAEGELLRYDFGKGGGGGGGDDTIVKVKPIDWPTAITLGSTCKIKVRWSSEKDTGEGVLEPTGPGKVQVVVNAVPVIVLPSVQQGLLEFDITKYVVEGTNKVSVIATDSYDNSGRTVASISTVDLKLTSNFDPMRVYSGAVNYIYTPIGNVEKTVHFIVDGNEVAQDVVKSSNEQQSHRFSGWRHGHHILLVYFTCVLDGNYVKSNELYYDLAYAESGNYTPIITTEFRDLEQKQYDVFNVTYRAITPNRTKTNVELKIDGVVQKTLSVTQDLQSWEIKINEIGEHTLQIKAGATTRDLVVNIKENKIDVKPVTNDLQLALTSEGRSNAEEHPEIWKDSDRGISASLTNFNFVTDGWVQDEDKNTVLRVSGDARVVIPFKIFSEDFKADGKTIELEFATRDVLDYETTILSCFSDNIGLIITPQLAKIKSVQSELQTQYKEDDHVRLSFVIEKNREDRLMQMYINGIMCGACRYPTGDIFSQTSPVNISIGSNDATIDIYTIRVYKNNLTRKQVVNNWIADTQSGDLKRTRYTRNDNYNDSGEIVIDKLPSDVPYMIWDMDILPQYKGDKRPGDVEYIDPLDDTRNFTSTNATYNVQGTSSAGYPIKNIRIKYKQNKDWPDKPFTWLDKDGETIKSFAVTNPDGIGDNYFTYKVDFASSEGANNVELTKYYNDVSKVNNLLTPAQKLNNKIRVGVDGFPIVAFQRDANNNVSFVTKANFNNDKANEAVYGFEEGDESWETTNNTALAALFKVDNLSDIDHYDEQGNPVYVWQTAFEARYPEESEDITKLQEMVSWVYSTYKDKATGKEFETTKTYAYDDVIRAEDGSYSTKKVVKEFDSDTAECRLAKFKAELADHFNVKSALFYYLFTHVFLMVDSRAKNAFPTYLKSKFTGDGGDRWFFIPYDMDTALGINNEGKLVFDYNLEDIDKVDGADVFNGQSSVLWCNLREMYDGELGQLYSNLRTNKDVEFSYSEIEKRFSDHQGKWSETIFNEDSYKKYIVPLRSGDNYLEMLQGSKAEQRKWWLYNRFKYFDSKYLAAEAKSDVIQFRAYVEEGEEKPNLYITPYADIYASASYANGLVVSKRAHRGEEVVLENPFSTEAKETDQETYIYSASQLKYIGDLSPFKPDTLKVANATRLQALKVGDASPDYDNPHLSELTLGANKLLKTLDVRNCSGLKQAVSAVECTNLEEAYFDGTQTTGVELPEGGILKVLHLPDTITDLTIINQKMLTDLTIAGVENVRTLRLENIPDGLVDIEQFIRNMIPGGSVRVVGFKKTANSVDDIRDLYSVFDTMHGIDATGLPTDKAQINGVININTISYADWVELSSEYPDIEIKSPAILCTVVFKNDLEDVDTQIVVKGSSASDPGVQHRSPNAQYKYIFDKWDHSLDDIQSDLNINALYTEEIQVYTFKFDPMSELVEPIQDRYVSYNKILEKPEDPFIEGAIFNGWFKEPETLNAFDFNVPIAGPFVADENDNPVAITLYGKWTDEYTPNVSIQIEDYNKFKLTITDNIAVTGYAITTTNEEPTEFISITPTSSFVKDHVITSAATYYVWGRDAAGHVGMAQVKAVSLIKQQTTGTDITFKCGDVVLTDFTLQGREILTHVDLDDHYENLLIKIDDVISDNDTYKIADNDLIVCTSCSPKSYTVKFNMMGKGSEVEDQTIAYNHLVSEPQNQYVEEGYITDGWYTEPELINKWNFEIDTVSEDTTLYVKWKVYIAPSRITVIVYEDSKAITCTFYQSVQAGVVVDFGDGSEIRSTGGVGVVSIRHTYAEAGRYTILITCKDGTHLLGDNYDNPAIMPISQVEKVVFAYNMPYTRPGAFRGAINLEEINLTNYMTKVAANAFENCKSVKSISIPKNITSIEEGCFKGCSEISGEQVIHSGITAIGNSAFMKCSKITKFNLPNSLKIIGSSAFDECTSLEDINLDNVTYIGSSAFSSCTSLKDVDLSESVAYVGAGAFAACSLLEKVTLRNEETEFESVPFNICPKLKSAGPIGGGYNIEYAFTTKIPSNVFSFGFTQSSLKSIILSDTIEHIGDNAFINSNITSIVLPLGLKTIGERAFERTPITKIDIPISVESIGARMLAYTSVYDVKFHFTSSSYKADVVGNSFFYGSFVKDSIVIHLNKGLTSVSCRDAYGLAWNYINEETGLDDNLVFDLEG